ncbi:MAG TPA: DNA polymerase I [Actinomycetota bacterium]|nr:DNA polymerase I [Actinomycetota bacterium]
MSPPSKNKRKVLLLDGHSLAYRAFYALPPDLRTSSGQVTNAVYGFTGMLIKALQDHKSEYLAVAFDKGAPLERLAIRPEYKEQRVSAPDEFRQQLGLIREVLEVLTIPVFEVPNVEADDIIFILGSRISSEGDEVIVVTADRDYFQMVGTNVKLMMNRRGISDTVVYDVAGVKQRFGFGPERYLDYAALRGDPSDNIQGVPGVGEKTASSLVVKYETLENIFEHLDELTPKLRANLAEAQERLLINREFFRFRSEQDLVKQGVDADYFELTVEDLKMGDWDFAQIRKLFDALEFRILYERLAEYRPEAAGTAEGFEADVVEVGGKKQLEDLASLIAAAPKVSLAVKGDPSYSRAAPEAIAVSIDRTAYVARAASVGKKELWNALAPALKAAPLNLHGSKEVIQRLKAAGAEPENVAMDAELGAYLIDPARGSYTLVDLARHYLGRELRIEGGEESTGDVSQPSLLDDEPEEEDSLGLQAVAVAELADVLAKELRDRGLWDLFVDLEIPLVRVLARIEHTGVKIDVDYLNGMSKTLGGELAEIEKQIYDLAGGPFNIGSPPQLREVLYERLQLKPSKKTKTGFSTDASVLESLRDEHPIIDLILRHRERAKLKSTYLDALPPLVDAETRRLHCRFNQTVASTGRLSSDSPNLQNIPIRTEEGRQIRRAFIPEEGFTMLVADYSQIELRILAHLSRDEELVDAFNKGKDIHRSSIAKALGIDESEVTPDLRSIGKMVSYGVTYGMGPFGLSQRLRIPVDQARTYIDGFFALYPGVRKFLDGVVEQATEEGFTTTMLGRRRYVPELKSRNPRVRSLGERQALNAPIQGSAADIMKLAMVESDKAIKGTESRMVMTVHDELVFEVPSAEIEQTAKAVKDAMENCLELSVPLKVDIAWGPNWAESKG